ncbi:MAG: hypothetical protein J7L38_03320, partial [Thermoproteales archaeon]|nr:hypothetical protein [Thermoproteales archaeon]
MMLQLKPLEESFFKFIHKGLKRLDAVILCEGKDEAKAFKAVARRLGFETPGCIGVTDAEGIKNVPKLIGSIILLMRVARKIKGLAVLVDMEELDPRERVKRLTD